MAWKPTGRPKVRQQRDKWVVRIDGIDTETGKPRPRQLGTFTSKRRANTAASQFSADGDTGGDRRTVGSIVTRWAAGRVDVAGNTREEYEWAAGHIKEGIGAIRLDRLERDDVAKWLERVAGEGKKSRRSIQIFRTVLRAALDDAVDNGDLRRNPAARVGMPRVVAKGTASRKSTHGTKLTSPSSLPSPSGTAGEPRSASPLSTAFAEAS